MSPASASPLMTASSSPPHWTAALQCGISDPEQRCACCRRSVSCTACTCCRTCPGWCTLPAMWPTWQWSSPTPPCRRFWRTAGAWLTCQTQRLWNRHQPLPLPSPHRRIPLRPHLSLALYCKQCRVMVVCFNIQTSSVRMHTLYC